MSIFSTKYTLSDEVRLPEGLCVCECLERYTLSDEVRLPEGLCVCECLERYTFSKKISILFR